MASQRTSTNFRNAENPSVVPVPGQHISGEIPKWLEGNLYRNGPGITKVGPDTYNHLFDGLSTMHRFHVKDGKVEYQSRYLESDSYKKNMKAQRIVASEFGTLAHPDPCKSLLDRFKSLFTSEITDNCNINFAFYGDQMYAMTETPFLHKVDPNNLETLDGKVNLTDYITVNTATAHPHIQEDGTVLNMGNNFKHKKGPHYCIIKVPPKYETEETSFKDAKIIAEIPCRWKLFPSYYHSFGMTTDKIIFIEQPYCMNVPKLLASGILRNSYHEALKWYPNEKTRIYVVSMENGEIHPVIYETNELFTFHHANAYEEDGQIVLDVSGYNNSYFVNEIIQDKVMNPDGNLNGASARRYVLPLEVSQDIKAGENLVTLTDTKATAEIRPGKGPVTVDLKPDHLSDKWAEFPRINYKYNGKKYNFLYGLTASQERFEESALPEMDIIFKIDIATRQQSTWTMSGILASEPIFVPNPTLTSPEEDDGVILSALLHRDNEKKVSLVILDAKNMNQLALVEFTTEGSVTSTFHGMWAQSGDRVRTY